MGVHLYSLRYTSVKEKMSRTEKFCPGYVIGLLAPKAQLFLCAVDFISQSQGKHSDGIGVPHVHMIDNGKVGMPCLKAHHVPINPFIRFFFILEGWLSHKNTPIFFRKSPFGLPEYGLLSDEIPGEKAPLLRHLFPAEASPHPSLPLLRQG